MIIAYILEDKKCFNQREELIKLATSNNVSIDKWVVETCPAKRTQLYLLKNNLNEDDIILMYDVKKISRNARQLNKFLSYCYDLDCQIWTVKEKYKLGSCLKAKEEAIFMLMSSTLDDALLHGFKLCDPNSQNDKDVLRIKKNFEKIKKKQEKLKKLLDNAS